MPDDTPIATEVIYEDDEVRIWNQVIEPGKTLEEADVPIDLNGVL